MHLFKRLAGGLIAVVLMVSLLPCASARQLYSYLLDANNADEIAVMLDGISDQTFDNADAAAVRSYMEHFLYKSSFSAVYGGRFPYTNAQGYWAGKAVSDGTYYQVVNATGCMAYCRFVSQVIYGTAGVRRDLNERAGRITGDGLKSFLKQYAQAGEHIRIDGKHSVTFVTGSEEGFYYLDYAGDQNPRILLRYSTYSNFAARCNELYRKVWIYEANSAINVDKPETTETYEPADWLAGYVEAAEQLGLTQSGNTLDYNSGLSLAETVTLTARAHSLFVQDGAQFQVESGQEWYMPYVSYLRDRQLLTLNLNYAAETTREQFVALMYAAVPENMVLESLNASVAFADIADISDPAAAEALYQAGVLTGVAQNEGIYFHPDELITRGEAIALVTRLAVPEFRVTAD